MPSAAMNRGQRMVEISRRQQGLRPLAGRPTRPPPSPTFAASPANMLDVTDSPYLMECPACPGVHFYSQEEFETHSCGVDWED